MKVPEPKRLPSGTWFIRMRLGGVSVPVSAATKSDCKRQATLIKSEYKAGVREIKYGSTAPTLTEAIDKYIDKKRAVLSPSTIRGYKTIQNNYFGSIMQTQINKPIDWQSAISAESRTHSSKTVRNAWGFICSVLKENGITSPRVTLPQDKRAERPFLQPDEIPKFVKAVKSEDCAIPALLGLCSLRKSETMALTWDNVDIKNEIIHVRGAAVLDENGKLVYKKTNKNSASTRDVPIMIPELAELLKAVPEKDRKGLLVTCNPNTVYKRITSFCEKNGFPNIGTHGLRHSFVSLAYHIGMSEMETMEIGGYSDFNTMRKIYTHLAAKDRIKAVNKMKQFYKNANENANGEKKSVETQAS